MAHQEPLPSSTSPSHSSDEEEIISEGYFTAERPPQYNHTNLPSSQPTMASSTYAIPRTMPDNGVGYQGHNTHTSSWLTGSLATGTANQTTAGAGAVLSPPVRGDLMFLVEHDYDNSAYELTTSAIQRLDSEEFMRWQPKISDWIGDRPCDLVGPSTASIQISTPRNARTKSLTETESTAASSWTSVSAAPQDHEDGPAQNFMVSLMGAQFPSDLAPTGAALDSSWTILDSIWATLVIEEDNE